MVNPFVPWAADYGSASLIRPTLPTQEFTGIRIIEVIRNFIPWANPPPTHANPTHANPTHANPTCSTLVVYSPDEIFRREF